MLGILPSSWTGDKRQQQPIPIEVEKMVKHGEASVKQMEKHQMSSSWLGPEMDAGLEMRRKDLKIKNFEFHQI